MTAKMIVMNSPRFQFNSVESSDKEHFLNLYRDPLVMEKIMPPLATDQVHQLFESIISTSSHSHFFKISEIGSQEISGLMGFLPFSKKANKLQSEFGIVLYPQHYQNGIAKESITTLINYGFSCLKLDSAFAHFRNDNVPIRKIAEHLDFRIYPHKTDINKSTCSITRQVYVNGCHFQPVTENLHA
ncbi:GNAT family N-acetyltransferase [Aliiglaciecola sp.]|nr:GNAT family N-acetyltransferase [Aliiglaciecola sp.]